MYAYQRHSHSCHLWMIYFTPSPLKFVSHFLFIITYGICIISHGLLMEKMILSRLGNGQTDQGENSCYIPGSPWGGGLILTMKSVTGKLLSVSGCSAWSYLLLTTARCDKHYWILPFYRLGSERVSPLLGLQPRTASSTAPSAPHVLASLHVCQAARLPQGNPHKSSNSVSQLLHGMPTNWLTVKYFLPKYLAARTQEKNGVLKQQSEAPGRLVYNGKESPQYNNKGGRSAGRRKCEIRAATWLLYPAVL